MARSLQVCLQTLQHWQAEEGDPGSTCAGSTHPSSVPPPARPPRLRAEGYGQEEEPMVAAGVPDPSGPGDMAMPRSLKGGHGERANPCSVLEVYVHKPFERGSDSGSAWP